MTTQTYTIQNGKAIPNNKVTTKDEGETKMNATPKVGKKQVNRVKALLPIINYTKEEYEAVDATKLAEVLGPRLSLGNAKKVLVSVLRDNIVEISDPESLMDWTYKAVAVEGINGDEIVGKRVPEKTLTKEEFASMTSEQAAGFIKVHTTEKRAGEIIMALVSDDYFKPTEAQVVQLANGRIAVEGVSLPKKAGGSKPPRVVVLKGIKINGVNGK